MRVHACVCTCLCPLVIRFLCHCSLGNGESLLEASKGTKGTWNIYTHHETMCCRAREGKAPGGGAGPSDIGQLLSLDSAYSVAGQATSNF